MWRNSRNLVITNPCSNNWDEMIPQKEAKQCIDCNKIVYDFTNKTDDEILHFFKSNISKSTCGRFHKKQIDTIIIELDETLLSSDLKFWKKFLLILLVCFGSQLTLVQFSFSQGISDSTDQQIDSSSILSYIDTIESQKQDSNLLRTSQDDSIKFEQIKISEFEIPCDIVMGYVNIEHTKESILKEKEYHSEEINQNNKLNFRNASRYLNKPFENLPENTNSNHCNDMIMPIPIKSRKNRKRKRLT